jgi:hypothetical protein
MRACGVHQQLHGVISSRGFHECPNQLCFHTDRNQSCNSETVGGTKLRTVRFGIDRMWRSKAESSAARFEGKGERLGLPYMP